MKYNPQKIEHKWQSYWASKKMHQAKDAVKGKENYMLLTEFPYPSGNLHIGHWYAFALPDILARYLRMKGKNVMYPVGFDAFGLPAENAAIQRDIHPGEWTKKNMAHMTKQLESMGASFDWSRELKTTDPQYYKWTQWMFLKMYQKGLAYRAKSLVNWCPKDKTVLANEQVVDGKCDRDGTPVIQKEVVQWMFRITEYADRLIDDIEGLDWPQTTVLAQKNWIGRSEGAVIKFKVQSSKLKVEDTIDVFTTRADTLFGATYVVLAPEHPLLTKIASDDRIDNVGGYVQEVRKKSEFERANLAKDKTGVFTGAYAVNPVNNEKVPVWVADYVLGHYGTGAVMAVPAHDERDWEFAKKYKLPVKMVICPNYPAPSCPVLTAAYTQEGHLVDSGRYDGLTSEQGRKKIVADLEQKGLGQTRKNFKLHDWVLSRQRYWGVPIPMIRCPHCGYVPVPEKELPVQLPPLKDFKPTDDARSPLAKATEWLKTSCPKCGGDAERETDTMDTFVDSSWYFIRYADPKNKKMFAAPAKMKKWLPVQLYIGGAEHNTMHLLYSRFFAKVLTDLGYTDFPKGEPFRGRRNHGIILGPDGQKMSKSRGNVVDPDVEVSKYGADTVRMYLAFMAPYEQGGPWDPKGINGVSRFLHRVWDLAHNPKTEGEAPKLYSIHKTIKKVGEDIHSLRFNTAVSELMKFLNQFEAGMTEVSIFEDFLKLLAPLAPHITEEIWQGVMGKKSSIHQESWPEFYEQLLVEEFIDLPVQVNGKVRDVLKVAAGTGEGQIKELALASEGVKRHLEGKTPKKVIYILRKMVSIVV